MFRAYLAVIHDSFRAALASRVLYIVLGLILLVLVVLAPLHLREQTDWELQSQEHFINPPRLALRLVEEGKAGTRGAVEHVWNQLSPELQQRLEKVAASPEELAEPDDSGPPRGDRIFRSLANELNAVMARRDFYDAEAFSGKRLPDEATMLLNQGTAALSDIEVKRLNRLLIATALRRDIAMPRRSQIDFYYGPWRWDALTTSISHAELANTVSGQLLFFFDKFVMSIGIFIAILVTASIIPEMLEPGSLNLLLSKPVFRWGLLLAKFVGGCAFILLCAAVFFSGIWLWMGIQLGMWESAILYSIPIYLVVFAMYYSVSVLAGIWFRSPILCITFAVLFWAICFAIGFGYQRLNNRFYNIAPVEMVAAGNGVMYVDLLQNKQFWNGFDWETVTLRSPREEDTAFAVASFMARLDELPDFPGPVWDPGGQRLLASDAGLPAGAAAGSDWISVRHDSGWTARPEGKLPTGTRVLLAAADSRVYALDRSGFLFRRDLPEPSPRPAADPAASGESSDPPAPGLLNRLLNSASSASDFVKVSGYEEPLDLLGTQSAAMNEREEIALYSRGQLTILSMAGSDQFQVLRQAMLGQQENLRMTSHVQFRGDNVFIMFGNGRFFHIRANGLETVWTDVIASRTAVRSLSAAPDGRFVAVTFRDGRIWLYDVEQQTEAGRYPFGGQGDIMTATFDAQGRLWTGDRFRGAGRGTWTAAPRSIPGSPRETG